jgi:hypothetical protein
MLAERPIEIDVDCWSDGVQSLIFGCANAMWFEALDKAGKLPEDGPPDPMTAIQLYSLGGRIVGGLELANGCDVNELVTRIFNGKERAPKQDAARWRAEMVTRVTQHLFDGLAAPTEDCPVVVPRYSPKPVGSWAHVRM